MFNLLFTYLIICNYLIIKLLSWMWKRLSCATNSCAGCKPRWIGASAHLMNWKFIFARLAIKYNAKHSSTTLAKFESYRKPKRVQSKTLFNKSCLCTILVPEHWNLKVMFLPPMIYGLLWEVGTRKLRSAQKSIKTEFEEEKMGQAFLS